MITFSLTIKSRPKNNLKHIGKHTGRIKYCLRRQFYFHLQQCRFDSRLEMYIFQIQNRVFVRLNMYALHLFVCVYVCLILSTFMLKIVSVQYNKRYFINSYLIL